MIAGRAGLQCLARPSAPSRTADALQPEMLRPVSGDRFEECRRAALAKLDRRQRAGHDFDWLADPCDRPARVPSGWISDAQVESLWRQDRLALLKCGDKVEVLSGRSVTR